MEIERLKSLSASDRKAVLDSEAFKTEEGKYEKPLTPEELAFFKDQVSELCINEDQINDELKDVKKTFKARLEPIVQEKRNYLRNIRFKSQEREGRLYLIQDFETEMIHKVDQDGNIIHSRKMLPEERQKWAFAINQKSA
jgi:hypothetical protein